MKKDFYKPSKRGTNIFYCQAKYSYANLFDATEFVVEFESSTLEGLKNQILDYKKSGLSLIDVGSIYVMHTDIKYDTKGFSFKQEFIEKGYFKG